LRNNGILFPETLVAEYVRDDLEILHKIRPDVVVGDMRLSLAVSGPTSGIPYIALSNAYWSPWRRDHLLPPPYSIEIAHIAEREPSCLEEAVETAQNQFNSQLPAIFEAQAAGLDAVRQRYHLSRFPDYLTGFTWGDRTMYADLPTVIQMNHLPRDHRFIGPMFWAPQVNLPEWWDSIPSDAVIIYVAIGSSGHPSLLPRILEIASRTEYWFVFATGGGEGPVQSVPRRCFIADYLPGDLVVKRANLVISNGGSPGMYQALSAGVPVLGIPFNMDQLLCMRHAVATGAVRSIRADCLTAHELLMTIDIMIRDSSYGKAAQRLQKECARMDLGTECGAIIGELIPDVVANIENG